MAFRWFLSCNDLGVAVARLVQAAAHVVLVGGMRNLQAKPQVTWCCLVNLQALLLHFNLMPPSPLQACSTWPLRSRVAVFAVLVKASSLLRRGKGP